MLAFIDVETLIPLEHPLRTIKHLVDETLAELSPLFDTMYAEIGRPSIPPERLLKASLLMSMVEPTFERSTFPKNRQRLLRHSVAQRFFDLVVVAADRRGLLSDGHFTVDGTLIEAAASLKSFKAKDQPPSDEPPDDRGNPTVNFHGQKRS
ncbi:MAG TPA: IS5/IS1182 family transposase, partial [Chloroflexota bacterium]|nr:IS5/IS1182 family transposase [Chloroflexota bacterium]